MLIDTELGIQPTFRKWIKSISEGAKATFDLSVSPTTLGSSATAVNTAIGGDGFTRQVLIKVSSTDGDPCLWVDGYDLPVSVSIGSASGTVSIQGLGASGNIELNGGQAVATLIYTGTFANAEATVFKAAPSGITLFGKALTVKTSTDTLIA